MRTLILALLIVAPTAQAADTQPIKGSSVREVTTSPSYDRPSSINGITRVKNLTDDVVFTSWVGSLGTGPVWLGFRFAGTRYVSKMTIIPGCAGSNRTFGEFGRPKNITLVAGKRETKVKVADRRRMQEIMVDPPLPAQSIKVLITETYKGRQQGVCISEIRFHEQTALGNVTEETRAKIENLAGRLHLGDSGAVVEALVRLGPAAVPRLSLALRDKSTRTQHNALKALYELGSPTAAEALVNYWKRNPPTELRMAALRALARTGDVRGIKYVVEIVGGDDYEAAEAAAEMTAQFGPDVLPALSGLLRGPHRDVRDRVLRALSTIRHPGVVALAAPFVSAPTSKLRAAAAQAIAGSGDEAGLVHLRKLSKDPHPTVRLAIARNADRFPPGEGQQLIARLARDADEFVARTAIETLARMPNGAQYLAKYIAEPDVPLGREAIALLAETGKAAGLDIMVEALRRGEMRYRKTIRLAIG
ncbi:MAG: HEAT repeat protein [Myxococcota bacterium]|jgi:HEAT repeat protein